MLRTCAAPPWVAVAFPLSLVSFKRADFRGAWRGFCNLGLYCADVELGFGVANILHTGDKIGGNLKSSSTFALLGEMNEAACLISMVFEIPHPKSPGVDMHNRERPCLEHVQQSNTQAAQHQHMF